MIKPLIATIALALLALPSAANAAEGIAAAEPVAAVTETPSPVAPDGAEISPPAPERNDAGARPHKGRCRHGEHRHGEHPHEHSEEHRHGEHSHGFCPHGGNNEKDGEHGRAPHGRENAVTLPCGIADLVIDRLTPEVIAVYERRIAGAPLLSEKSEAELSLAASELKLSVKKYEALVLLADIMARTSKPVPLSLLASLGDGELLRLARRHAKLYAASLTEEERDSLKDEFRAALKK